MTTSYAEPRPHSEGDYPVQQKAIVVLLVDQRAWTREALARALEAACGDLRVQCFEDASNLLQAAPPVSQAVVLLNFTGIALADRRLTTAVATARSSLPGLPVVAISDSMDAEDILSAVERGLSGYIPNSLELPLVIEALRYVTAGGTFVPAEPILASLDAASRLSLEPPVNDAATPIVAKDPAPTASVPDALTPREIAVLDGLRQGQSNKQIARELSLREPTIKVHIRHIMRKFGVANRTQVALFAERLRPPDSHS